MKKILIVLICLMIIVGCENKKNTSDNPAPTEEHKVEVKYYDEEAVQARSREIAEDVYEKKTYVDYEKVDGMLQTAVNNFQILVNAIARTVSVRKVKKISAKYKELIHTYTVILIHKFDIKEMGNPRIRAAVIKNILGPHSHNYDSFLAWS